MLKFYTESIKDITLPHDSAPDLNLKLNVCSIVKRKKVDLFTFKYVNMVGRGNFFFSFYLFFYPATGSHVCYFCILVLYVQYIPSANPNRVKPICTQRQVRNDDPHVRMETFYRATGPHPFNIAPNFIFTPQEQKSQAGSRTIIVMNF